ncbi:hypothetical protein PsorP6_000884 [Peronosclerospora sorghi]|uniref:Uncharacterized protein n=1 Tax=Peronosclerospora sorghi TaxID=230839 RepID=A0ACC0WTM9_9STRA|nr:hypothetical protein PsorP6_000884 [Peronosclerospora sorghi]
MSDVSCRTVHSKVRGGSFLPPTSVACRAIALQDLLSGLRNHSRGTWVEDWESLYSSLDS